MSLAEWHNLSGYSSEKSVTSEGKWGVLTIIRDKNLMWVQRLSHTASFLGLNLICNHDISECVDFNQCIISQQTLSTWDSGVIWSPKTWSQVGDAISLKCAQNPGQIRLCWLIKMARVRCSGLLQVLARCPATGRPALWGSVSGSAPSASCVTSHFSEEILRSVTWGMPQFTYTST